MPSISLPAIGTAIAGVVGDIGIPTAIASTIGSVAAPALVGSGIGGLTAALTGGKVLKGMGYGALGGGTLGGLGAAFPATMGSLGISGIGTAAGAGAAPAGGALSAADWGVSPAAEVTGATYPGAGAASAADWAVSPAAEVTGAVDPNAAAGASGLTGGAANIASGAGAAGASSPGALSQALNYARLAGAAGSLFAGQPGAPNYGNLPGPSTTAATQGPFFNAPLSSFGSFNRTPVQNYRPNSGTNSNGNPYYSYGQSPQPQFWNNNQVGVGNSVLSPYQMPLRMAHGGALARAIFEAGKTHGARMAGGGALSQSFDTRANGGGHVQGDGGGQDDVVEARLAPSEYVMDAATMSRLGDGNPAEGARRMDKFRKVVASHAGAKEVVPPKAKSPMQYLSKARAA